MFALPPLYTYVNLGPIIGDAVHNLRAALDHIACEIVGRAEHDMTKIFFPMNDTRQALVG